MAPKKNGKNGKKSGSPQGSERASAQDSSPSLPRDNRRQNKMVRDAARDEKLNAEQRRRLGRAIEEEQRKHGIAHDYRTIRDIAKEIKGN